MKNNNKTHRRTQSSSFYDFRNLLPNKLKENNVNTLNFIENHQVPDRNLTKEALDQSKNSQLSAEKTVFVENLNPSLPDLNKKEDNFLVFGKKNRNYSSLFGYEEKILSMKNESDKENRSNPAKRYEEEFTKETKCAIIPEQNDLIQSIDFQKVQNNEETTKPNLYISLLKAAKANLNSNKQIQVLNNITNEQENLIHKRIKSKTPTLTVKTEQKNEKHKKNTLSAFFIKPEKNEKNIEKNDIQLFSLRKRLDNLETSNKNLKHQMMMLTEEKNYLSKKNEENEKRISELEKNQEKILSFLLKKTDSEKINWDASTSGSPKSKITTPLFIKNSGGTTFTQYLAQKQISFSKPVLSTPKTKQSKSSQRYLR